MWRYKELRFSRFVFWGTFLLFILFRLSLNLIKEIPDIPGHFYMISQILCVLIVSGWMFTVQKRIIYQNTRRQMIFVGICFQMYFFMQMCKYCLFDHEADVCRYMWYGYYIPMTLIPLLAFYILHDLSYPEKKDSRLRDVLIAVALLICMGFLTTDLHQLAFKIPNWYENGDKGRTLGPVYYFYIAFMIVLLLHGIKSMYHLYQSRKDKKKLILPAIPLVIGILYLLLYTIKPEWTVVVRHRILELSEIFAFMMIGFLEMCIQIGLIPSNMGYEKLFHMTEIPARILDLSGNMVFETSGSKRCFLESENHRIVTKSVNGGYFLYDVDLTNVNRLNKELDEITTDLEARNEILQHENEMAEERRRPEEAIRIYDSISEIVRPQVLEIQELLSDNGAEETQFRSKLVRTAVLNAYIKRRSNMELEAQKNNGTLTFRELVSAMAESLEYFKLSGADTYLSASGNGRCPAPDIIRVYQAFESIAEAILGSIDYMTVRLTSEETICIRFLISGKMGMPDVSRLELEGCDLEYETEENDTKLVISLREGGDSK